MKDFTQRITVSIKVPSQTVEMNLEVPEMEVEDLVTAIAAQCEPYENFNYSDEEENDDLDFTYNDDELNFE